MYRQRFGLRGHAFPQDACGATFTQTPSAERLARRFRMLASEPGLGVLVADAGLGKTTTMRHLTSLLPRPTYQVTYLCDTATSPLDFYRQLATELGVSPSHRRAQLWHDIKECVVRLVDTQGTQPVIVVDEAQHLSDRFLLDLAGFLNFAFDSRNLLVFWLVGQPLLHKRLSMTVHAALDSRVCARIQLEPLGDRKQFAAFLETGMAAAGARSSLFTPPAVELLFRASHGIPRRIGRLVRESLMIAHERNQDLVDDTIVEAVLDDESWS